MPIYEYECKKCGKMDIFHNTYGETKIECPFCGGPIKKLITTGAMVKFNGSGFTKKGVS